MEVVFIAVIAVFGVVASMMLDRQKKRMMKRFVQSNQVLVQHAKEVEEELHQELSQVAQAVDKHLQMRNVLRPSLIQIAECVVYTQRTLKTIFDPISSLSFVTSSAEKVLAVGPEIDPLEFGVLLEHFNIATL